MLGKFKPRDSAPAPAAHQTAAVSAAR
jgi:hypothetical protein